MAISTWNPDWFALPGQAVFDRDRQQVAAVSRSPGHLDLFIIGFDNRVWSTSWSQSGGWNDDWFPLPGAAVFDRDTQQLAAVSRGAGSLDLFVIGFDNRVWSMAWSDLHGWNLDWFPLPGKALFDHRTQQVAAVSRAPGNLDLFVLGFDNRSWSTFWTTATGWHGDWFALPGHAVFDHATQRIAAVSRAPGHLDLFVLGFDNHAWSTFWSDSTGWHNDWFPLPGRERFDHEKQHLAVVARTPENLDVFVLGVDNRAWSTFWTARGGWNGDFFPLPGAAVFDRDRQRIAAVARAPGNLDLFVLGFDNHGWSTSWSDTTGWRGDWFALPGQHVFNRDTQQLTVVARAPSNLDLFVIGFDNHVWSTFWGQHDAHPAIRLRAVAEEGRFVEVEGVGFTPNQPVKVGYDIVAGGGPTTHQFGEDTLTSDAAGRFIDRIKVNLGGNISGAQAQATDLASNEVATASI
jgi:hypothetical protein